MSRFNGGRVKTSDLYPESEHCLFSDLPGEWCACWAHRPDVTEGIPGRDHDDQGEA